MKRACLAGIRLKLKGATATMHLITPLCQPRINLLFVWSPRRPLHWRRVVSTYDAGDWYFRRPPNWATSFGWSRELSRGRTRQRPLGSCGADTVLSFDNINIKFGLRDRVQSLIVYCAKWMFIEDRSLVANVGVRLSRKFLVCVLEILWGEFYRFRW